jgi:integrase
MARGDGFSIIKRTRNARELPNYQVRVQVPQEWRQIVGKNEVLRSLGTGDRRAAARLAPMVVADLYTGWKRMAGGSSADVVTDPKVLAVQVAYDGMLAALEERRKAWPADDAEYAARLSRREVDRRRLTRRLQDGDLSQWEAMADRMIAKHELPISKGNDEYEAFVRELAELTIDALDVSIRQSNGELGAVPRSAIVQQARAKEAAKAKPGETLLELFELWSAEELAKRRKRSDTVNQDRKVISRFADFIGAGRDVGSITPIEVAEYRDTLRNLPPKWMSKRELRDLDMRAAASKARSLNLPQMAFTNVNKHLSTISPLFKWLAKHPKWAGLRNPVDGLFYDGVKGQNRRPSFGTDVLNKIFSSPLFTGFLKDGKEAVPGDRRAHDWRYWIPLVCLFSGARVGEIAQLRLGDVRKECGVWFFHIRHDEDQELSTKSGETRVGAVHSMLQRMGFLAFHARQLENAGGDMAAPLFPEIKRNARGQISATPSRWWREYLIAIGVKDAAKAGGDGQGAHSFRHTLTDRLRSEAELLDTQIAVCLGHSVKTTTSGYGSVPQGTVNMLKGYIEGVRFDGVDLSHLIAGFGLSG